MKAEKQRIAIAEACGAEVTACICGKLADRKTGKHVPDYLNDLNAMHKAEKHIFAGNSSLWSEYLDNHLPAVCERDESPVECATATQRAEAFLRAIGKWEDEE